MVYHATIIIIIISMHDWAFATFSNESEKNDWSETVFLS